MKILVTCGPASVPIDEVRRITNFATGEIGTLLSDAFTKAGHEVICFRGKGATHPSLPAKAAVLPFDTNESLLDGLRDARQNADAIFHAAALADFTLDSVEVEDGTSGKTAKKISSAAKSLTVRLVPGVKVLPRLRDLFPAAKIVGWKFELDGDREAALSRGRSQISTSRTDACVVNGSAYGEGFGFLTFDGHLTSCETKAALASFCAGWLEKTPSPLA